MAGFYIRDDGLDIPEDHLNIPEYGNMTCSICGEAIKSFDEMSFWSMRHKLDVWYKPFHNRCYEPKDGKKADR